MIFYKSTTPRLMILIIDIIITISSVFVAFLLRFNFHIPQHEYDSLKISLLAITGLRSISFLLKKNYKNLSRYTSTKDIVTLFALTFIISLLLIIFNIISHFKLNQPIYIPFSIIIIEFLFSLFGFSFYRLVIRLTFNQEKIIKSINANPILIYGTSKESMVIKDSIEKDISNNYKIMGFISEDPKMKGSRIMNMPIYQSKELQNTIISKQINYLINSDMNISSEKLNEITTICLNNGVKILTIPPINKWINNELNFNQIKAIKIEDLLERKEILINTKKIESQLKGKIIFITGAAGSIGSEIARQVIQYHPKKIIFLDQSETDLYELELELLEIKQQQTTLKFILGSIRDKNKMSIIFNTQDIDIVFHAAAYKHVPMMENNIYESVKTNIFASINLVDLATHHKTKQFIFISTDKAINPTGIMGASKRVAEIYIQAIKNKTDNTTQFVTTRFGNVLGSKGSVIPLFKKQIEKSKPITITHPKMTRYFMTIPEACRLVLEAGTRGENGQIYIFDMGKSIKILDLSKKMIQLSGLTLDKDIKIVFTGLRPGEKLYEELSYQDEKTEPTHHPKIMISKTKPVNLTKMNNLIKDLQFFLENNDETKMTEIIKLIVPEFKTENPVS